MSSGLTGAEPSAIEGSAGMGAVMPMRFAVFATSSAPSSQIRRANTQLTEFCGWPPRS